MPFADANRAQIRYIEESSFGVTPGSGSTREVRLTSSSLTANKETVVSDELRADRMVSDIVEVAASSGGDINFEWSSGPQDEFLAAFLLSQWERPMTMDYWKGITVSVTANNQVTVSGSDITGYLTAGRRVKLDGFANAENNGYFSIASVVLSGSDTQVNLNETTLVAETGTANARLYDANDVIVLNDTNISLSAAGVSGNATNPFAAAIAAGQLQIGQKIFIGGLGFETATLTGTDPNALTTSVITINDGVNSAQLTAGVSYTVGVDADTDLAALTAAINALRDQTLSPVNVKATHDTGTDVITITNLRGTGGSVTEDTVDANLTVGAFAGGVAGASKVYKVTSLSDDLLGLNPAPPVVAAGAAAIVKGSHLKNSGDETAIQQRFFSIETAFQDVNQFMEQDGMVAGTFSLEIATGAIVTGTVGFEGRATSLVQSTVLGNSGTYTVLESQPGEVVNATTDVGDITKDGVPLLACIQSISLTGEAGLRMQNCVGSKFPRGIGTGRFNLTGSMTVYFENEELFTDFIDHETISLEFSITDSEGQAYFFTIPALKISQDEIAPGGIDQDVFENIEFTAFRDPTTDTMFQIDRFSPNAAV